VNPAHQEIKEDTDHKSHHAIRQWVEWRQRKAHLSGQPVEPQPASALTGISGSGPGRLPGAAAPLNTPPSPVHPAGVVGERAR
jgi:hypothetical protein